MVYQCSVSSSHPCASMQGVATTAHATTKTKQIATSNRRFMGARALRRLACVKLGDGASSAAR